MTAGGIPVTVVAAGGAPMTPVGLTADMVLANGSQSVQQALDKKAVANPPYIATYWYPATYGNVLSLATASALTTTVTRLYPFTVRDAVTITDLGARVTTLSAGGLFRLMIYDTVGNLPTGLPIATVSGLSTSSVATVSGALAAGVPLTPGHTYFAAIQCDNAVAVFQGFASAIALGSIAIGSATFATASSGAATGISHYTFGQGYASGAADLTGQTITAQATGGHALVWWKAQ